MKRNLLAGFVVLMFAVTCAWAQTGTTSLRGTVTDKTGASVGEVNVSLDNLSQAFHRETQTSTTGEYDFVALPPGTYALTIEKAGFRRYEQKNLQLLVNLPATVNATLEVGATSQTVEVSASAVALNTTGASIGNAFGENQIKQLPLEGRNVPDLALPQFLSTRKEKICKNVLTEVSLLCFIQ